TNGIGLQPTMDWLLVHPDDNDNKNKDRCEGRGVNNNNKSNDGYGKIITSSNSSISGGDHELMIKSRNEKNPSLSGERPELLKAIAQRQMLQKEEKLARAKIRALIEADKRERAANELNFGILQTRAPDFDQNLTKIFY
ncbi:16344_t:CDS:2, partial [Entrophospora sp. SA101]